MAIVITGPLSDRGQRGRILADLARDSKREVASQALANVHHTLDARIRRPTPYYETQVRMTDQGSSVAVHDSGVVYGHWLEGDGSRNRTTRFKGYAAFRKATQSTEARVGQLTDRHARRAIARLNGVA